MVVGGSGEDLGLLGGNDGVPPDQLGHDFSNILDTHGQRGLRQEAQSHLKVTCKGQFVNYFRVSPIELENPD